MEKENLHKLIKYKFYFKYFIVFLTFMLYIPLIGIIVTQFKNQEHFLNFLIAFGVLFIVITILNIIYEKFFILPDIDSEDILYKYLCYFEKKHKYLEFTEVMTWFYRKIRAVYLEKKENYTDKDRLISNLYSVLRSYNNSTSCYALKHMESFEKLANMMIKEYETTHKLKQLSSEDIENFRNEKTEKHFVIEWIHDKNIIIYLLVFPIHICGCFFLALETNGFSLKSFGGNLCLYLPADFIAILLYNGFLKQQKNV